uniref:Uncharacterized protein n=1 Tax=Brassica oleracea var. oleracea TaxID=109376 RepID=A0A0D3APS0_BRAOL
MVGFFVKRLVYYKEWAWTTSDSEPQVGISGLITPLLRFKDIPLEQQYCRSLLVSLGEGGPRFGKTKKGQGREVVK